MSKYDTDVTTWSSEGRLYQIEYAMEAVKKGSAAVGAKSDTHVVLTALKRSPEEVLASYQEKVFKVDPKMGMAIAGITGDARELAHYMRTECMNNRYVGFYNSVKKREKSASFRSNIVNHGVYTNHFPHISDTYLTR